MPFCSPAGQGWVCDLFTFADGFDLPVVSHVPTPPWPEHVPLRVESCQYVPSLHFANAPFGFVSSNDFGDEDFAVEEVVLDPADAADPVVAFAGVVVLVDVFVLSTPPWLEHAPLPVAVLVVPSMQVTVAGAACDEAAAGTNTAANTA